VRNIFKFAAPIVVVAASVGTVFVLAQAKESPEQTVEEPRPVSLYVDEVRSEQVKISVTTQGEVRAKTDVSLVPQVSGRIVDVSASFAEGGRFKANETLIKIEDSDYRLAVTSAEARLAEAAVRLEQELADARIKSKQWEEWVHDGEPTPLALNKPQVAEAQAKLRAAEADLDNARLNLGRTNITVPFDGRVLERNIGVGQFVSGATTLGRVFATNTVEIRLPLTDSQLGELALPIGFVAQEGKAPHVNLKANIGGTDRIWKGRIARVNASVDSQSRLVYAIAEVEDPYGEAADRGMPLAVGLFVSADIEGVVPHDALVMPRNALRGEDKVYVINDANKLEIRTVDLLSTSVDRIVVMSGVSAGEKVVTSPVRSAYSGMAALPISRSANQTNAVSR
jgi:RND family efflux transporter MFP subunit